RSTARDPPGRVGAAFFAPCPGPHDMRLSIATKIFIAFSAITLIFVSVLMFGIHRTQSLHSQIRTPNHQIVPLSRLLTDVQPDLKSFHVVLTERDPLVLRRTLQFTRLVFSLPERFDERIATAAAMADAAAGGDLSVEVSGVDATHMASLHTRLLELHARATA